MFFSFGMNNFYFFSCFSRFIFNQVFLAFRSVSKHLVIGITYFSFSYYFSKFIFIQVYFMFRSVSKHLVIGMNNFYFYLPLVDLFLIKYFWLSEGCHSKHIVIGKNNFYFSSCFSRFIFNQEFLAFRSVSKYN